MADDLKVAKIVSGGQTGVDRAALDVAIELNFPCGGWVPKGRRAEDGRIPPDYPLRETGGRGYSERTLLNVRDSDATLILTRGEPTGGTALTIEYAYSLDRPHLIVDLDTASDPDEAKAWLVEHEACVLNVAGPRESSAPGIYDQAAAFMASLLKTG
jgi:hypothetical protein